MSGLKIAGIGAIISRLLLGIFVLFLIGCSSPRQDLAKSPPPAANSLLARSFTLALDGRKRFTLALGDITLHFSSANDGRTISGIDAPGRMEWTAGVAGSSGSLEYQIDKVSGTLSGKEFALDLTLSHLTMANPGGEGISDSRWIDASAAAYGGVYEGEGEPGMAALARALAAGISDGKDTADLKIRYRDGKLTINDLLVPLRPQ